MLQAPRSKKLKRKEIENKNLYVLFPFCSLSIKDEGRKEKNQNLFNFYLVIRLNYFFDVANAKVDGLPLVSFPWTSLKQTLLI